MTDDEGPRFDPGGPELVYQLIADDIARKIASGELTAGDRLPGEADMARSTAWRKWPRGGLSGSCASGDWPREPEAGVKPVSVKKRQ